MGTARIGTATALIVLLVACAAGAAASGDSTAAAARDELTGPGVIEIPGEGDEPGQAHHHHGGHAGGHAHHHMGHLMLTHRGFVLMGMHRMDLTETMPSERTRARRLLRDVHRAARRLFPSFGTALLRGYQGDAHRSYRWKWVGDHYAVVRGRPRLLHLNKPSLVGDGRLLDPSYPESLVYRHHKHSLRLVGFMYRAPVGRVPTPGGTITRWHLHGGCASPARVPSFNISVHDRRCAPGQVLHYGTTAMMHVWLGHDLKTGFSMTPPAAVVGRLGRR
jgi:hypothetical protein